MVFKIKLVIVMNTVYVHSPRNLKKWSKLSGSTRYDIDVRMYHVHSKISTSKSPVVGTDT